MNLWELRNRKECKRSPKLQLEERNCKHTPKGTTADKNYMVHLIQSRSFFSPSTWLRIFCFFCFVFFLLLLLLFKCDWTTRHIKKMLFFFFCIKELSTIHLLGNNLSNQNRDWLQTLTWKQPYCIIQPNIISLIADI